VAGVEYCKYTPRFLKFVGDHNMLISLNSSALRVPPIATTKAVILLVGDSENDGVTHDEVPDSVTPFSPFKAEYTYEGDPVVVAFLPFPLLSTQLVTLDPPVRFTVVESEASSHNARFA
jgi:hypothetical protein